ncbi:AAEL017292-PA [Aedes aegypti]|uniref:AAEL017292-PA n=1 Tax=Aedes aegypti TaxID=7159 RepID=J9HFF5_AEDAE|nr:AAEL017292-PA [Aedes aegypti]
MKLIVCLAGALLVLSCAEASPIVLTKNSVAVTDLPPEVENNPLAHISIDAETINQMAIIIAEVVNINGDGSIDVENPIVTPPPIVTTTSQPGTGTTTQAPIDTTTSGGPIITPPPVGRK